MDAQTVEVNELSNLYSKLKQEHEILSRQKQRFQVQLQDAVERNVNPLIYNRVWSSLKNWKSKRKRKVLYRSEIDIAIKNITECVKARVVLTLGGEDIVFQWSEQDLAFNREDLAMRGIILPQNIVPRYRVLNNAVEGALYRDRSDDPFRITHSKEEIRKVLFVIDTYSVATPAYHELHILSKGFLPALNCIKDQKKELSEKLDHYFGGRG